MESGSFLYIYLKYSVSKCKKKNREVQKGTTGSCQVHQRNLKKLLFSPMYFSQCVPLVQCLRSVRMQSH